MVECLICCEDTRVDGEDAAYRLERCGHEFCRDCLGAYFASMVSEAKTELPCCHPGCGQPATVKDLHTCAERAVVDKFNYFATKKALEADSTMHWCPAPQCSNAIVKDFGPNACKSHKCGDCGVESCLECGEVAHPGMSCKRFAKKSKKQAIVEDQLFYQWKKERSNVKHCPGCKMQLEKISGCPSMICNYCKCRFCWNCLGRLDRFNIGGHWDEHNPFGCWARCPKDKLGKARFVGLRAGTFVAGMVGGAVAIPLGIAAAPFYGTAKAVQAARRAQRRRRRAKKSSFRAIRKNCRDDPDRCVIQHPTPRSLHDFDFEDTASEEYDPYAAQIRAGVLEMIESDPVRRSLRIQQRHMDDDEDDEEDDSCSQSSTEDDLTEVLSVASEPNMRHLDAQAAALQNTVVC